MGSYHVLFGIILEWFTYTIGGNFGIGSFFFCLCAYMHTYIWKCLSCHVATSLTLRSFVGLGRPGLDWIDMWYSCAHKVLIHIPTPIFLLYFLRSLGLGVCSCIDGAFHLTPLFPPLFSTGGWQ